MEKFTVKNHILYQNGVKVIQRPSPNHGGIITPHYTIIHYTAAKTAEGAIEWMINSRGKQAVSAHLHIDRLGNVVQLVPLNMRAWHAGESEWKGVVGLNNHSIGIELQNTGVQIYTDIQLQQTVDVCRALNLTYPIEEILGHSDIAPTRKIDPGKQFPMDRLRKEAFPENI
jgi:N-acetylmuramoyl-L-alanine amidase